jgi:response regulator of citrate/malate metabolism
MIHVLIVEDDPMVAEFNKRYVKNVDGFHLVGIAYHVEEAKTVIAEKKVDLILLDVYMPGENGLELLSYIRAEKLGIDVILITAASDADHIQTALRYGAVDYLIKPFEFERFEQALLSYKDKQYALREKEQLNQEELDQLLLSDDKDPDQEIALPKGLTQSTLQIIVEEIRKIGETPFSTDELAEQTEISRVSIRKYLKFLVDIECLEERLTYGIGRPVYSYQYIKENGDRLKQYLSG